MNVTKFLRTASLIEHLINENYKTQIQIQDFFSFLFEYTIFLPLTSPGTPTAKPPV